MPPCATAMGLVGLVTFASARLPPGTGAERRRTGGRRQDPSRGHAPEFRGGEGAEGSAQQHQESL